MTAIKSTGRLVSNELALLRRLAAERRLASARMPRVQRSGLVHGPFVKKPEFPPLPKRDRAV